jgi:hypothetical protein
MKTQNLNEIDNRVSVGDARGTRPPHTYFLRLYSRVFFLIEGRV